MTYSRRQLAMWTIPELKERYVTDIRLGRGVKELKEALEGRGIDVPSGSNPKSLIE